MPDAQARILIFAKTPQPGGVKTRLIPALGPDGAAELQRRILDRTLALAVGSGLCPVECWYTPTAAHPVFDRFRGDPRLSFHPQGPGDLGRRMARAFASALARSRRVVLVGADCPVLTERDLAEALDGLDERDAVLGPAEDGGYLLIGLRRMASAPFESMPWGTPSVLAETRERLQRLGWRWHELRTLWDVDRPEDLPRLAALGPEWAALLSAPG